MSSRIYEAIASRWVEKSLDTYFPGGLWYITAPAGAEYPFVRFLSSGGSPVSWTSSSEFREYLIQMSVYYQEVEDTDPVSAVGSLMEVLDGAYNFATLSLSDLYGYVIEVRRIKDNITQDSRDRVWAGRLDYKILQRLAVDYSPS
jgi:hypothetical protein